MISILEKILERRKEVWIPSGYFDILEVIDRYLPIDRKPIISGELENQERYLIYYSQSRDRYYLVTSKKNGIQIKIITPNQLKKEGYL